MGGKHPGGRAGGQIALFVTLVVGLFVVYYAVKPAVPEERQIRVSADIAAEIAADRQAALGRAISEPELEQLVWVYVEEEMLIREARARGIECSGCNGRRHLVKRLLVALGEPPRLASEPELGEFFAQRRSDYQVPTRIGFEQVFLEKAPSVAQSEAIMEALADGADPLSLGQRFWTGNRNTGISQVEVAANMGESFAEELFAAEEGMWTGPLRSARGTHFVRVFERIDPRLAEFEEVRVQVELDWSRWADTQRRQHLVAGFRDSYDVEIEPFGNVL